MLTVALGIVVAANAFSVVLLAAMWTARASRRSQRSRDLPEVAGLLQECAGAKGAAWTRARSVLATQHSRSTRQHRVSWDPRVKGSSNDQGGLSPMHSWPPAHALKGPGRPGLARPPLASSSSLGTAFKGQRQPAQQPPDAAGAPVTAGLSKNVVLRALYKQHFTQTGAGDMPQDGRARPFAPSSTPEDVAPAHAETPASPFALPEASRPPLSCAQPVSDASCSAAVPGERTAQDLRSQSGGSHPCDTLYDALLEASVSTLLTPPPPAAMIGPTRLASAHTTEAYKASILQELDLLPV